MRRFRGCQPSWYLLKTLYKYLRKTRPVQACGIPVVSWSLYFWKSVFSFRADSILKSDGDFILNWKFPDCVDFSGARAKQAVIETIAFVYEHTKRTQEMCLPIGHNNTKHFLCPIRSWHPLEFLEMVWWESVPRGSSAHTWNLSSRLFSRPDWLPLGLRGWCRGCQCSQIKMSRIERRFVDDERSWRDGMVLLRSNCYIICKIG